MFIEILVAIIIGVIAGIITGLTPGIHVNLIAVLVVGFASSSFIVDLGITPFVLAVFIVSLALTHSFLDSIPSIYLGAPNESQIISALPGHQLFLQGKGHQAILFTIIGSLSALFITLLVFPFGIRYLGFLANYITPYIGYILLCVILFLLIQSGKFILNLVFFLLAGFLGLLSFSLPNQTQILLPLLSGLFGVSTLLISLMTTTTTPKQDLECTQLPITINDIEQNTIRATIVGILASFLPGFGSSQAAIVASSTMKQKEAKDYLLLVGGINTVNFTFSLVTMYVLNKARNGAIVGIQDLLGSLIIEHIYFFVAVLLVVGGIASILGIILSRVMAKVLQNVNYFVLVLIVICIIFVLVLVLSHFQGVLILITATSLGVLAQKLGGQKNMLLGCLLLPVLLYFL